MLRLALGVIVLLGSVQGAKAGLVLCNRAEVPQTVGVGYKLDGAWFSEGWWTLAPTECKTLVGGDLKQRYYYYTVRTPEGFVGEGYSFCAQDASYELSGADGDCSALSAVARGYAQIDTGETATSFTFDLIGFAPAKAADTAPLPQTPALSPEARAESFVRGQQGEPFYITARLQECSTVDGFDGCFVYAEGWRWSFAHGAGSNPAAMAALARLPVNTMLHMSGDILSYGDITVEALLASIDLAPPDANSATLDRMQGRWVSEDDPQSKLDIIGSEQVDTYGDEVLSISVLSFAQGCPDGSVEGSPTLVVQPMGSDPDSALCYAIDSVTADRMTLMYLPRGNFLTYLRR